MRIRMLPVGRLLAILGGTIAFGAACGSTTPTITSPSLPTLVVTTWQFFSPTVAPGGTNTSTFTVAASSTVSVTLGSIVPVNGNQPAGTSMRLVLGTPASGGGCTATSTQTVTPSLTQQIQATLAAGTYCVNVTDVGGLPGPSAVLVRVAISNGTPSNNTVVTGTEFFTSTLGRNGAVTHEQVFTYGGAVSVTLTSVGTDNSNTVGLAFGIWDGTACRVQTSVNTTAGTNAQISTNVDAGSYCVRLLDLGTLTSLTLFSIATVHP
jgi:hypothetical protein